MTKYDLESVNLPKLSGTGLRLFANALENGAARAVMLGNLLQSGGILKLREMRIDEPPTMQPIKFVAETAQSSFDINTIALPESAAAPFTTIQDYAAAYRAGTTTPEAVAEKILTAVAASDKSDKPLRAFIAQNRDDIMAQARAATERIKAGAPLSLLDGVPVAVKDEVDQVPYPTTVGTAFWGKSPAVEDATVVARLRAAGALLIGKANMYEIGINPEGFNAHYGMARNPYNLDHDPGGSSSGPAAATAAGFCPVSIGADGGGSIRIPAAHCGLVGLKATYGRISEHGAAPLTWTMGHLGPIGATVADVALTYAAIAGPDEHDPVTQHQPPVVLDGWDNADLSGLRLGVYRDWFNHATPDIVAAGNAMLEKLRAAGAAIHEIEIPGLDAMRIAHAVTILSEMAASTDNIKANPKDFGAPVRVSLVLGRAFTARDYVQAQRIRTRALAAFEQVYEQVDVILSPATAVTSPKIPDGGLAAGWSNLSVVTELMRFVVPGNFVGLPAISFPMGYTADGLPIGMQAMGRHWEEHLLLRVAYAAEQVVERRKPLLHYQILE
ncbi:MAG: amidase [Ardenticatenaceae bacterium]|nr:amidase [Ardenticatenaceae bacterium]MCB9446593.1 amidase [Ardenticatenaceae bacterium]